MCGGKGRCDGCGGGADDGADGGFGTMKGGELCWDIGGSNDCGFYGHERRNI